MSLRLALGVTAALLAVACGDDTTTGGAGTGGQATGAGGTGSGAGGQATGGGGQAQGGGGSGTGGGTNYDLSECKIDADCPGGTCVDVGGGYHMCKVPVPEATSCTDPQFDTCCTSADCMNGDKCYLGPLVPFCGGVQPIEANECGSDECASDADCNGGRCLPAGVIGNAVAMCVYAECFGTLCGQKSLSGCALVRDPCCNGPAGFFCIDPETGCTSNADCPGGYCDAGTCMAGGPICPA